MRKNDKECTCYRDPDLAFTAIRLSDGRVKCPRCGSKMEKNTKSKSMVVDINSSAFENRVREIFLNTEAFPKKEALPRFEKLADGWEKDRLTGIDRGPTKPKQMTQQEAMDHFAKQGYRLETIKEYESIIDRTKSNPALVDGCQLDVKTDDYYMTSSLFVGDPDCAWFVDMRNGGVYCFHRDFRCYVRPVRASQ